MTGIARRTLFLCAWLSLVVSYSTTAHAQASPGATPAVSASTIEVEQTLSISQNERRAFALGDAFARASFSYAPLVHQAVLLAHASDRDEEVDKLAKLAPEAAADRAAARWGIDEALILMQQLDAPAIARSPVAKLSSRLDKPIALAGDAATLRSLNPDAATVLASLDEAGDLSLLLEAPDLTGWLRSLASGRTGPVWYADGLMEGIGLIAAQFSLPDLLPRTADVATDLRGFRDWLASRLPETPTPDQATLRARIDQWLGQAPVLSADLGRTRSRRLSPEQLQALGVICAQLRGTILGPSASPAAAGAPPSTAGPSTSAP